MAIAIAQINAGDIAGAHSTLASAVKTADSIGDAYVKDLSWKRIAGAQAKPGDIAGAQTTADLIQHEYTKREAQSSIEVAQRANAEAQRTTKGKEADRRSENIDDWRKPLDNAQDWPSFALNTASFLDLDSELKSLPPSDDPDKLIPPFLHIVRKIAKRKCASTKC